MTDVVTGTLREELYSCGIEGGIAVAVIPEKEHEKAFFTDALPRSLSRLLRQGASAERQLAWMADLTGSNAGENERLVHRTLIRTPWTAIRRLRNEASHPSDQSILPPNEALHIVDSAIELINPLFSGNDYPLSVATLIASVSVKYKGGSSSSPGLSARSIIDSGPDLYTLHFISRSDAGAAFNFARTSRCLAGPVVMM